MIQKDGFIPDEDYKKIIENVPICCVDLVILHNNKILLVFRKNEPAKNKWWFPGGRIYKNEKLKDAVSRKAYGEVGLKIEIIKKIGVYELMFDKGPFNDLKSGVHGVNICFLVKPVDNNFKIKCDGDSLGHKWFSQVEEELDPYIKEVLKDAGIFE